MSNRVFMYSEMFQQYDMGPEHPLKPIRLKRTYDLLASYGALDGALVIEPRPCSMDALRTTHSAEFIETVDRLSTGEHVPFPFRYGFGHGDNPVFPDMWDASLLYAGASLGAAEAVAEGRTDIAMNISGGLHHAHYDKAAGFCVFNDCAVAIHRLRRRFPRVAYVDIDVHHGDGVQEAFYHDPTVLTVSIHETGVTLFPGSGFAKEIGVGEGVGCSVNIPLWPGTDDEMWVGAWREVGLPILKAFEPDAICLAMGADPHFLDPLARISLTAQGWLEAVKDVKALGKPIVALGGGGYNPTTVPRMWALAYGVLFDVELPDETPASFPFKAYIPHLTDGDPPAIHPHDRAQARTYAAQTVAEVKERLFARYGLPIEDSAG